MLPLPSVLVLHVEAVSGLKALDAFELESVESQVGLVGLEGLAFGDERVETGKYFVVFEYGEVVGVGAVEFVAEHEGTHLAVLYFAAAEVGLVGRSHFEARAGFAEEFC